MEEFSLVRKIKIIGKNAIERCAPSRSQNMNQTNDSKRAKAFLSDARQQE